jgi:aryl-alcohol dehydrogenase-like predicted oxidoreductase
MQTKSLGNSDLNITPLGFGSWAIGGGNWAGGWGPQDDRQAIEAIERAVELGINWIDTAAVYGLGHSEELVGEALRGLSHKPYIFTKCVIRWDENRKLYNSMQRDSLRYECEQSLRRLGVDQIDLYQIHWPDPDDGIEEGWETLARLQEEGLVRWIGVSNFNVAQLERAQRIAPITSLQPPYSLLDRHIEAEILPFCAQHNIGVIAYSPMASGLLTGAMTRARIANFPEDDWRRTHRWFQEPELTQNLALAGRLAEIGAQYGLSAGEVAIAWTLRHAAITGAIAGARSAGQVEGIIGAMDFRLSEDELAEIES